NDRRGCTGTPRSALGRPPVAPGRLDQGGEERSSGGRLMDPSRSRPGRRLGHGPGEATMTIERRNLLLSAGAAAAGAAAIVLDPMTSPAAAEAAPELATATLNGFIPYGAPDWVYIPVDVPAGVNRISVSYSYDRPAPPPGYEGNALDIGIFDENGIALGDAAG